MKMFHRNAIIFNSALFMFCFCTYYAKGLGIAFENFVFYLISLFQWSNLYLIFKCFVLFAMLSFLFIFVVALIAKINVGKPPMNGFLIAYKYGLSDTLKSSSVNNDRQILQGYKKVYICYERRVGPFGIAHGAIIGHNIEQVNQCIQDYLNQHGYSMFYLKPINNALYISSPTLPWLSFFGVWLVLRIAYPKMYKFSKAHKLSAYPVIEIYDRFSVLLMAPLSRQDDCVVPEADSLMNRSCSRLDISSFSTTTNLSSSVSFSKSPNKSIAAGCENDLIGATKVTMNNGVVKHSPILTLSPKLSNGLIKHSVEE